MTAIQIPGDVMYFIRDPLRDGYLIWMHDDKQYIMAFTTSGKAEEYNHVVLKDRLGEIVMIHKRKSIEFAKRMVSKGVEWMVVDYPVINDQDFWDEHPFELDRIPREVGRHYGIVHLKPIAMSV